MKCSVYRLKDNEGYYITLEFNSEQFQYIVKQDISTTSSMYIPLSSLRPMENEVKQNDEVGKYINGLIFNLTHHLCIIFYNNIYILALLNVYNNEMLLLYQKYPYRCGYITEEDNIIYLKDVPETDLKNILQLIDTNTPENLGIVYHVYKK